MKRLLLAFIALISIATAAQDAVLLRVNYQQGDTYVIKINTNAIMGMENLTDTNITMETNVEAVEDGLFKTKSKLTSVVMAMEQGGMSMSFDSSKNADELDEMGQMMKTQFDPMMNATIYATVDELGTNVDTRIEPSIAGMEQLTKSTGALKYPVEKISVGSTWTAEQELQGMTMKIAYTVRSIADGMAMLDITGDMSGIGTGSIKGTTTIDISTGIPTLSELQVTVTAQGIDVSTTVKTTMTKV